MTTVWVPRRVRRVAKSDKQKFRDTREKTHNIDSRVSSHVRQLYRSTNCVSRNAILANARTLYEPATRLSAKKKYPANIARDNDIWYLDNKVLANIPWFDIRCDDCLVIERTSSDGKVLMRHSMPHVCSFKQADPIAAEPVGRGSLIARYKRYGIYILFRDVELARCACSTFATWHRYTVITVRLNGTNYEPRNSAFYRSKSTPHVRGVVGRALKRVGKLITDSWNSVSRFGGSLKIRRRCVAGERRIFALNVRHAPIKSRVHIPPIANDHKEN